MIVARNLTKRFGKVCAVDSIDLDVPRGRVIGFLGPNGAGKTTTIRMITGFLTPSAGRVEVDGLDVTKHPREVRRRIGYMPESNPLYSEMRVVDYLLFRARLYHLDRARRRQNVAMVLERCSLESVRRRPIGQLSKGYRQRVGLAAALVHEPPLLILDEPTAGLDPTQIREVRSLVRDLAGRHTILLSTHILSEVELTCDGIIMMSGGRVQEQSSITDLRRGAARGCQYIVETDAAEAGRAIEGLPSIESVETTSLGDAWYRLTITPVANAGDRREVISRTLKQQGAAVRELKREAPTLEQLFVQLTEGPARPSSAGAPGDGGVGP